MCSTCEGNGRVGNTECDDCGGQGALVTKDGARLLSFITNWTSTQEGRFLVTKPYNIKDETDGQ